MGEAVTRSNLIDSIFIGIALIALGLIGAFIGRDPVSLAGVVMGVGVIAWSVWQRRRSGPGRGNR
jgi:hypothetical protein